MKTSYSRALVVFLGIVLLSLSCTLPIYFGTPESEATVIYIEVTSTPAPPVENTATPTQQDVSITPTVSVNLDGKWIIWYGVSEEELDIDFLQQGYNLTANVAIGGDDSMLFKGTISQDGTSVNGTWESTDGSSGNFMVYLNSAFSAFSGNLGGGVSFCGVRAGSPKPSPCLK